MASKSKAESRRMYSWWWDSHISPKNSKWLQENLTDMDVKVKQMIKLIEEDADSFARRAEMYYKKRPELMKLVEEFYRAYRALAERYDHATGALRQAHRTMAEAFPNQVPLVLSDDSPAASATESDPRTPDMTPIRAFFDPNDLQKDGLGTSLSNSHAIPGRKGLKQLSDLFGSGEGVNQAKFAEGRARKGLNFQDAEDKERDVQTSNSYDIKARVPSESERVGKAELEIVTLKNALAKLEAEKEAGLLQYQQSLERLSNLESEVFRAKEDSNRLNKQASKAEAEVQLLKVALTNLETEREASLHQYQQCLEKISDLESNISHVQRDAGELSEQASKAENEAQSLKQELARLQAEKDEALSQYNQCVEKIPDLENKLLLAEEDAKRFNERADKAEKEVENLKQALIKLTSDNEASAVQLKQCFEKISCLERELTCAQEEAQRLNSAIDEGVAKLKGVEERCLLLENSNQSMHSELETLVQKVAAQSEELTEKQKELGRLWACIQKERLRFVEAETAFQTLQHLHSQSQEDLRSMTLELQKRVQILEIVEASNQSLQDEVEQVKVVNKGLSEANLSSSLTIQNLQNEILSLRETIGKLEAEVELRVDQRNALQQEIYCLKEELNDLKKNHWAVVEQVESVGFKPDCFGSSVKDLQDENVKLKEVCGRDKSEKVALLEKLEIMEKLIEKNALLENSLSDLNVELEGVREKVKALEESCQSLLAEKSALVSEKATLVSQLQVATENLERLTENNNLLENSLLDANAELEGFRVKSKNLEDLCLLLENEKSDLVSAKGVLIAQLDITNRKLEDVEKYRTELEGRFFSLDKEREFTVLEVEELRVYLDTEKQERASLAQLSKSQLSGMASQICMLEEEVQCRKKEYEEELDKAVNSEIEIFILQTFAKDLEEKNLSLLLECQKLVEASKRSDKFISELKHENLEQKGELKCLFAQIEVLRMGLYHVLKTLALDVNQPCEDKSEHDKILLNHAANKLQETQDCLFKMQDENQKLGIENSVFVTLIGQLQLEVVNLVTAKNNLDNELKTTSKQLLVSTNESQILAVVNEELRLKIMEGDHKEEVLKVELKNLQGKLLDLQRANQNLLEENWKVLDEQKSLLKSVSDLREEKCNLEEESCAFFAEKVSQDTLSLIFRGVICEKSAKLEELSENLDKLGHINNDLMEKVKLMEGKLDKLNAIEVERTDLHRMIVDLRCKYEEVEVLRAEREKQILKLSEDCDQLSKELDCIHEANQKLESELFRLRGALLETKRIEESLNHEIQKGRNEAELWESHAALAFGELQISTVREALFEGKVHELIETCESLNCRNCSSAMEIDQLKDTVSNLEGENGELKAQISACVPAFVSLRDCVTSLENHTLSYATVHEVGSKESKDTLSVAHTEGYPVTDEEHISIVPGGFLDFEKLQVKIRAIEKAVMEKERLAMLEYSSAYSKLEAAMREIEELKSRNSMRRKGVEMGKDINPKAEHVELGDGLRLQKWGHEITEEGNEVMTKDIMLDQVSEGSSYGIGRRETVEIDDQMLEIWETTDHDGSIDLKVGKTQKANTAATNKKHNREHPSTESLVEKEVSVDRLEISKRFSGSRQEGNERKILERLDSDAQKLTNLQITVQDLKKKVEINEKSKKGEGIEYDSVKEQLEESEEAIMKLLDANRKLMKSIGDESTTLDEKSSALASDESENIKRRKIAEQARRVSEKIGRLQVEVQKLQFLLLKLDDENKSRGKTKIMERKTRVLLRDYLYGGGTRSSQKRRKGHFCACMQPPTKGD